MTLKMEITYLTHKGEQEENVCKEIPKWPIVKIKSNSSLLHPAPLPRIGGSSGVQS